MTEMTDTATPAVTASAIASQFANGALGRMSDGARQAGEQIAGHSGDLVHDARERGASLAGEVKSRLASAAQDRKQEAAGELDDAAKALHRSGEQLEGHQDWIAHLVERGADELGTLAATLRTNDLQGLLSKLLESIRDHRLDWHSFLTVTRTDARRRNASPFRFRHSQSLASRRQRLSHPMVRSTIQRLGSTTNVPASERLTISTWI